MMIVDSFGGEDIDSVATAQRKADKRIENRRESVERKER